MRDRDGGQMAHSLCAYLDSALKLPRQRLGAFYMVGAVSEKRGSARISALPGPVGFIGAGKVGTALASLLYARGVEIAGVSGRSLESGRRMARLAGLSPSAAQEQEATVARANLVFLTVPDDAIGPLCEELAAKGVWRQGQGVVHCSGSLPSSVLQPARDAGALVASFHPLQAFATAEAALAHMPGSVFALEGDPTLVAQLEKLVKLLEGTALLLTPEQKTIYHAAAVLASNYAVTLAALASQMLVRSGAASNVNEGLRYLLPLIRGTVDNLAALGLPDALTGPLVRGDAGTVARHLAALEESTPEIAHLYRHLAQVTLPLARQKGHLDEETLAEIRALLETADGGR